MNRSGLGGRFRRLLVATGLSAIGDGMALVAFPLLALQFTHSPVLIASVSAIGQVPAVLVGLPAGVIADRVNRRRLLLGLEVARFLIIASFATTLLLGVGNLALLYLTVLLLGGLSISFDVAVGASLSSLVPESDLVAANTRLLSAEVSGEELVGQAVGGAAFAIGRSVPFVADAASFVVSAFLLPGALADMKPEPTGMSAWRDLQEGLRWFLKEPILRLLTSIISTLAFCQAAVLAVFVLYVTDHLHLHEAGYGFLLAVAATSNLAVAPIAPRIHRWLGSAGCIAAAGIAAAVAYPVLALTHSSIVAAVSLMVETSAVLIGNVASRSLRQSFVPASMQGRAAATFQTVILVSVPLGGLAGGVASAAVGIRDTFLAAGALQLLLVALLAPRLRARLAGVKGADPEREVGGPLPEGGVAAIRAA